MTAPSRRRIIFNEGYINHVDVTTDGAGNEYIIGSVTVKRMEDGKLKDHIDAILKRKIWGSGVWETLYVFDQPTYGKHGYCAINVIDKHLVLYLVQRQPDDSQDVWEYTWLNIADNGM